MDKHGWGDFMRNRQALTHTSGGWESQDQGASHVGVWWGSDLCFQGYAVNSLEWRGTTPYMAGDLG